VGIVAILCERIMAAAATRHVARLGLFSHNIL